MHAENSDHRRDDHLSSASIITAATYLPFLNREQGASEADARTALASISHSLVALAAIADEMMTWIRDTADAFDCKFCLGERGHVPACPTWEIEPPT